MKRCDICGREYERFCYFCKNKVEVINIQHKKIRAKIIKRFLQNDRCYCFSCGNASKALETTGVNVIGISPRDYISSNKYMDPFVAREIFGCFDATSGNLPLSLIPYIVQEIKNLLPTKCFKDDKKIFIPLGSGELFFSFMFLFKVDKLIGVHGNYAPITFDYTPLRTFIENNVKLIDVGKVSSIIDIPVFLKLKDCYFINTEVEKNEK